MPKGINFVRLTYPPTNSEIIVCGLKRRAMLHSSFVNDLLLEMKPECTFLQLAPDHPLFIRPEDKDYRSEWHQFIRRSKYSDFYVNPKPKYTSDVVMSKERVKSFVNNCIKPAENEFELGSKVIYSQSEL